MATFRVKYAPHLPSSCRQRSSSLLIMPLRAALAELKVRCRLQGFVYDALKALNPRIIMVNVSAYGLSERRDQQLAPLRHAVRLERAARSRELGEDCDA